MITMSWMTDLELRIVAQTPEDVRDLREVMNPYGAKKIVIEKCALRLLDVAGFSKSKVEKENEQRAIENQKARRAIDKMLDDLVKTGFLKREEEEDEQQLERNRVLKEKLDEITMTKQLRSIDRLANSKEAKSDTLHS